MRVKPLNIVAVAIGTSVILAVGFLTAPIVFADRILPGVVLGGTDLSGVEDKQLPGAISAYNASFTQQKVEISLRGQTKTFTLKELGVELDSPSTVNLASDTTWWQVLSGQGNIRPQISVDSDQLNSVVTQAFENQIEPPRNATLILKSGKLILQPSSPGESVDMESFAEQIASRARSQRWNQAVELSVVQSPASVLDSEVDSARAYASRLLAQGFTLTYQDKSWDMRPYTLQRMLRFEPAVDSKNPSNHILGVTLDSEEITNYLTTTISPDIAQTATDARFERKEGKVEQFEVPREGRELNVDRTAKIIATAISSQSEGAEVFVDTTAPNIKDLKDIEALGITQLLAEGESDYVGSPANRVHNIKTGTASYHGLLIEPGQDFSFNQYLGPVDAAHGYKPELVIKSNQTIAEFGGGLCQVSTTLFRAAVHAGLEITQRRNHAYAVRYYGTPGFDATIYPPYTDLRFINNTPGYILIQARIDGTKLQFELWGTDDGREVEVTGPVTYDRQPDGSVKATVKQRVTRNGEVLIDESFYSRYRSPDLYPKVQGSSTVSPPPPAPTNDPTPTPNTATNPAKSPPKAPPKASPKPSTPSS